MRRRTGGKNSLAGAALALALLVVLAAGCNEDNGSDELAQQSAIEDARQQGAQTARQNARIRELRRELKERESSSESVPSAETAPVPASSYVAGYQPYSPSDPAYGYVAEVPVGGGWSSPAESHPTSGALLRTTWRGPDGTLLIIDRTPEDVPDLGGSYDSVGSVPHPIFGQATKYTFSSSTALPDCNGRPCVDFLIHDGSGGGWGVLAGGPSLPVADAIAGHVAESVSYVE